MKNLTKEISEMQVNEYKIINMSVFGVRFHVFPDGTYWATEFTSENQSPMFKCAGETIGELLENLEIEMKNCANTLIECEMSFDSNEEMSF